VLFREAEKKIRSLCRQFPVVVILGPRQVGKTTLIRKLATELLRKVAYFDMEIQRDWNQLSDPELFFESHRHETVIIDEVQFKPEVFQALRPEIDRLRKNGRFILTGSASPDLVKGVSESLAGRVAYVELTPFSIGEITREGIPLKKHWFRGGFPGALLARSDTAFHTWCEFFIRSYVERDLSALFGSGISPALARNFWNLLAVGQGNIWNAESFARSLGVSAPTMLRYLEFMEGAFLVRRLPAWYINAKKRMVKAPKIYVRDSGLVHHLNHIDSINRLNASLIVGASWEGYVVEEICRQLPHHIRPYYYRTYHGAETDLVLANGIMPIACIEIKYSSSPSLKEGFYNCVEDLKTRHNYVIYAGKNTFKLSDNVVATGLASFLDSTLNKIMNNKAKPVKSKV
jgi:predicted AAA+ superfamily ATPase